MAKTRLFALQCCTYVFIGLSVRPVCAMESVTIAQQGWDQNVFSMLFDSWRVLLVLGILAGLINLLAKQHNREALGIGIPRQFFAYPVAFCLAGVALILIFLSATSLPTLPILMMAQICVLFSWTNYQKTKWNEHESNSTDATHQMSASPVSRRPIIRIELGKSLLSLASSDSGSNLVNQIASLRADVFDKLGIKFSSIHIKDDLQLSPNSYRIYVRNGIVGEGVVHKDRYMVIEGDQRGLDLDGIQEHDPVFGMPVLWITEELQNEVGKLFVQVMDPVSVIITHLSTIVDKHASELLSRDEVFVMVNELRMTSPRLVSSVIGKTVSLARFHRILQALLEEHVSVKDLALIVEKVSDTASLSEEESVEEIRSVLRRQICSKVTTVEADGKQIIRCVELPEAVESAITNQNISKDKMSDALRLAAMPLITEGLPIVVVSSKTTRRKVKSQIANGKEDVFVLSRDEIVPEVDLQVVGKVQPIGNVSCALPQQSSGDGSRQTVAYARSLLGQSVETSTIESTIEDGIAEIKNLVGEVLDYESAARLSPLLNRVHRSLIQKGIEPSLAAEIVHHIDADSSTSKEELHALVVNELIRRLPRTIPPPSREACAPTVIAVVGPTGVGKTTTIAKLATKFNFQQGRSVSLITADTYRVAAVDQLKQYADLFDATFEIAGTQEQMKYAIESCRHSDIVLIDTAGRSASDDDRIQETADILKVARPDETHLVLSAATSRSACQRAASSFSLTGYDRVIVTKLDEIELPGETISALCAIGSPLSWFTDGQDISSHINLARPTKLVGNIFQS